jgi:hypothetical protein
MVKENVSIYNKEFSSQTSLTSPTSASFRASLHSPHGRAGSNEPAVSPGEWPSHPMRLQSTGLSKWFDRLYDGFLCLAPVLLMVKAGLVVRAYHVDKYSGTGNNIIGILQFCEQS